ncbi:MAG TPA: hypothetical protein VGO07_07650 [Candidatus Saccharimonadales bacterium]|jgi:hypothetical protein|nr:hypothetical protein [Candidatus Saccharimonadales bacterium]
MHNFLKEKKKIVKTITKFGTKEVVAPEVHFYLRASDKFRTPELHSHADDHLTIEYIDGISCFNYLKYLDDPKQKEQYLHFLVGEVLKFQEEAKNLELAFAPYAVEEKLDETIQIMKQVQHPMLDAAEQTREAVLTHFHEYATVPFRDATPKNSIIKLDGGDINQLTLDEIKNRTYHYDFSTVGELTSKYDDIISTLYHHFVDDAVRDALLKQYGVDKSSLDFAVVAYLRIGRFWSRRYYYKLYQPELFTMRYTGEDIGYYDRIYAESLANVVRALGTPPVAADLETAIHKFKHQEHIAQREAFYEEARHAHRN